MVVPNGEPVPGPVDRIRSQVDEVPRWAAGGCTHGTTGFAPSRGRMRSVPSRVRK